uniref:Uncharacterized protein n=1 Tax=Sphaerodactylus townsendi TaxID=933632 RepID=A0ACB8EZC7_9SAUR
MRNSYTVTIPEEPPVSPFHGMPKDLRARMPTPGSLLVSTFVGLVLNKAKSESEPVYFELLSGTGGNAAFLLHGHTKCCYIGAAGSAQPPSPPLCFLGDQQCKKLTKALALEPFQPRILANASS